MLQSPSAELEAKRHAVRQLREQLNVRALAMIKALLSYIATDEAKQRASLQASHPSVKKL